MESKPVDAEEQPAAAKPNDNPATPVPQHVPLVGHAGADAASCLTLRTRTRRWAVRRTPPPRAPAPPSGSDEDSDEEDDESDSGSSPSLDD